jgi:hypothetical protein
MESEIYAMHAVTMGAALNRIRWRDRPGDGKVDERPVDSSPARSCWVGRKPRRTGWDHIDRRVRGHSATLRRRYLPPGLGAER